MLKHFYKNTWFKDILLLIFSLAILFGSFLGSRPLSVPDEARYSEIPREMIELSDYITPHLNYIKYFEKPPLIYWLQAASIKTFGDSEWALRLPTALLGLLGCILTYVAGRFLYDRKTGILSCFVLATSLLYFSMAHLITLDMAVSVFLTGSLFSFIVGIQQEKKSIKRILLWCCYIFAALSFSTKGLIGIILPGLVIFSWFLIIGQWKLLKECELITGSFLFLIIALPWYYLVQTINPEFFHFFFIDQHFSRYLTLSAGRFQPNWFFIPILLIGFFPWVVFLFQAIKHQLPTSWKNRVFFKTEFFLLSWIILIFSFFSISKSKLIPYILPVFPPLALITGQYLKQAWDNKVSLKGLRISFILLPIAGCLLSTTLITLPYYQTLAEPTTAIIYLKLMSAILLFSTLISTFIFFRKQFKYALVILFIASMLEFIIFIIAVPYIDKRSIKPLAEKLYTMAKSTDVIASYGIYFQDLPFYLKRKVMIVEWQNELSFGMKHQAQNWMLTTPEFIKDWQQHKIQYMVIPKNLYIHLQRFNKLNGYIIGETIDNLLVKNQ
ncbi:MAG: Undecaprenyl phosphate-alpha-4-amino-4-deoxy-L-arabinose arabinosyl transferase [Legionellaceae bacterium]